MAAEPGETLKPTRPSASEYAPFYAGYVGLVPETGVLEALERQVDEVRDAARRIPPEREHHRYAPGKWSIRQVFGHMVDAERVFGYRAFCFGRRDLTELPGFSENVFVERSRSGELGLAEHAEEFGLVRRGNLAMLRQVDAEGWEHLGSANGSSVSTRALAFIMVGHPRHHLAVLADRYDVKGWSQSAR